MRPTRSLTGTRSPLLIALVALTLVLALPRAAAAQLADAARPSADCDYQRCAYNIIAALHGLRVVKGGQETQVATLGFLWTRDISVHFEDAGGNEARAAVRTRRWGALLTDVGLALLAIGATRAAINDLDQTSARLMIAGAAGLGLSVPLQFKADTELARAVWLHNARYAPAR